MAQRFATHEELASFAGITQSEFKRAVKYFKYITLARWLARQAALGRYLIRQAQFDCAMGIKAKGATDSPNPAMLKWLGMQHLGQSTEVAELNKPLPPPEHTPSGYEILSPKAAVLLGPGATIDVSPQLHDEKPAVAAIIEAEIVDPAQEPKNQGQDSDLMVISGHTGERK